jgi:hypothetical protein
VYWVKSLVSLAARGSVHRDVFFFEIAPRISAGSPRTGQTDSESGFLRRALAECGEQLGHVGQDLPSSNHYGWIQIRAAQETLHMLRASVRLGNVHP